MHLTKTDRGFEIVMHDFYPPKESGIQYARLVQQSSAIGDYDDALDRPGTSYLWVGEHHHLNREEVAELAKRLQCWLETGSLEKDGS